MAFVERKVMNLRWDKPGQKVIGRLKRISKVKYSDGAGLKYLVRDREGVIVEFSGTTDINAKIAASDIGCLIAVEYTGDDTSRQMSAGRSQPKVFKVLVDESDRESSDPTQITDEDIPF